MWIPLLYFQQELFFSLFIFISFSVLGSTWGENYFNTSPMLASMRVVNEESFRLTLRGRKDDGEWENEMKTVIGEKRKKNPISADNCYDCT